MNSILNSIKILLGMSEQSNDFDRDIIIGINTAFANLYQLGVGPSTPFRIEDESATWEDFMEDNQEIENVKSYIQMKVRLLFDPPTSSIVMECIKNTIAEQEWRLAESCNHIGE